MNTKHQPELHKIIIEEHNEDGNIYYLAYSQTIPGLLVEASSLDEIKILVPQVARDLIGLRKERELKNKAFRNTLFQYIYTQLMSCNNFVRS